ncbi:MAG TPA: hypothetical protein V6D22_21215 [Candidatus Obscuribacterales bacterium]
MLVQRDKRVGELELAGGTKGLTIEHTKPVYFKDGRRVIVRPDGSSLFYYPNGGVVLELADGSIEQLAPYEATAGCAT